MIKPNPIYTTLAISLIGATICIVLLIYQAPQEEAALPPNETFLAKNNEGTQHWTALQIARIKGGSAKLQERVAP